MTDGRVSAAQWDALVGRDLGAAVRRAKAARALDARADEREPAGIAAAQLVVLAVLIVFLGFVAPGILTARSAVGGLVLAAGAVMLAGVAVLHALEGARARSRVPLLRDSGVPASAGLGVAMLPPLGFAIARVLTDDESAETGGTVGVALLMLAVGADALLVGRAVRALRRRPAGPRADERAFGHLIDIEQWFRDGEIDEARARRLLDRVRRRWARAPHPPARPQRRLPAGSAWSDVLGEDLAPVAARDDAPAGAAARAARAYVHESGPDARAIGASEFVDGIGAAALFAVRPPAPTATTGPAPSAWTVGVPVVGGAFAVLALLIIGDLTGDGDTATWPLLAAGAVPLVVLLVAVPLHAPVVRRRADAAGLLVVSWLLWIITSGASVVYVLLDIVGVGARQGANPTVLVVLAAGIVVAGLMVRSVLRRSPVAETEADADELAVAAGWLAGLEDASRSRLLSTAELDQALERVRDRLAERADRLPRVTSGGAR